MLLNSCILACRLRLTLGAALDVMPLGRRTDCGDARFAGVQLAVPASNSEACVQVSKSTSRHLALVKISTRARICICCRMPPTVVLTLLPPSCVDPPPERLVLNLYSRSLMQTLCWYHQEGAGRCTQLQSHTAAQYLLANMLLQQTFFAESAATSQQTMLLSS